jgi:hypothetical protein
VAQGIEVSGGELEESPREIEQHWVRSGSSVRDFFNWRFIETRTLEALRPQVLRSNKP